MDTYLTCSADLCKHTSGCSANKSRLYCPLTSAELPIVNVTQLQRRASTVDWGSLSLTSWLTAATHNSLYQRHETHTQHAILSSTVRCTGLPASGRLVNGRSVRYTSAVFSNSSQGISKKCEQIWVIMGWKGMSPLNKRIPSLQAFQCQAMRKCVALWDVHVQFFTIVTQVS